MSINKIFLTGSLVDDPDYQYTKKGVCISTFIIAVHDWSGIKKRKYFFYCVAYSKTAKLVNKNLFQGAKISIEGKLVQFLWIDYKTQKKKKKHKIIISDIEILTKKCKKNKWYDLSESQEIDFL